MSFPNKETIAECTRLLVAREDAERECAGGGVAEEDWSKFKAWTHACAARIYCERLRILDPEAATRLDEAIADEFARKGKK